VSSLYFFFSSIISEVPFSFLRTLKLYILLFCLSLIKCEKMANWPCEPTQIGHKESHQPSMNQTAVVETEAGCWQSSESDRERMLVDCQLIVGDNRDRAQPTCGHGTCGYTFWLKFCCFTCTLPSEFAWLLCATALSVLYNHCTENVSCKSIVWFRG